MKKNKPRYTAFANSIWTVKKLIHYSPMAFLIMALLIPVEIGMQYLDVYLPALVVSEVVSQKPFAHALLRVGMVLSASLLGNVFEKALGFVRESKLGVYRHKMEDIITRKKLGMFYQEYEKKEVRDLGERAQIACELWDGSQPLTDIVTNFFGILKNVLGYLFFGTVISFASPWLIPILTIAPAVNLISVRIYNKWEFGQREKLTDLEQKLRLVGDLPDDFTAAKDIRIYSMASWLKECYRDLSAQQSRWDKQATGRSFASRIGELLVILLRDGGAYALLIAMIHRGEITVDEFILYFAAISSFASWIGGVIDCWNNIHTNSLKICDFREYAEYEDWDGSGEADIKEYLQYAPEIVFDHVSFRYEGAKEDTIRDLSFTLHSGEKLAIVGSNGAGKTTIVKLLVGLYRPTSGEIRVNGRNLSDFRREDYYRLISPVFQDVRTAFFSLAETVSGAALEHTDTGRVEACMRRAGLGEKLESLSKGLDTRLDKQLNDEGTELSGGEAQKLMLSRALYKDAPMLVLDEPTAALDPIAESHIYETYHQMCKEKTSLFISHRLASTAFCDRVILLEQGKVAEEGTHEELLARGGAYREMFDIQSCWYREEGGEAS